MHEKYSDYTMGSLTFIPPPYLPFKSALFVYGPYAWYHKRIPCLKMHHFWNKLENSIELPSTIIILWSLWLPMVTQGNYDCDLGKSMISFLCASRVHFSLCDGSEYLSIMIFSKSRVFTFAHWIHLNMTLQIIGTGFIISCMTIGLLICIGNPLTTSYCHLPCLIVLHIALILSLA